MRVPTLPKGLTPTSRLYGVEKRSPLELYKFYSALFPTGTPTTRIPGLTTFIYVVAISSCEASERSSRVPPARSARDLLRLSCTRSRVGHFCGHDVILVMAAVSRALSGGRMG